MEKRKYKKRKRESEKERKRDKKYAKMYKASMYVKSILKQKYYTQVIKQN